MASKDAPPKPILKTSIPSTHASSLAAAPKSPATSPPRKPPQPQQQSRTNPKTQSQQYQSKGKPAPDPRHLAIALHHAQRIQAQKDAQALILNRILELIALPSSPTADPAAPSAADANTFKNALLPFQPSDYDNLIQERNIEGLCGYALCPREHRKEDPKVKFRILWGPKGSGEGGRGREMKVVPREKLEMWCSDKCAERAMYVRVQLAEEPVWERRVEDGPAMQIMLLEEARALKKAKGDGKEKEKSNEASSSNTTTTDHADDVVVDKFKKLSVNDKPSRLSAQDSKDLALERGDSNPAFREKGRVDVQIVEKDTTTRSSDSIPAAPVLRPENMKGGSIEGYTPKDHHRKSKKESYENDDDFEEDEDDVDDYEDVLDHI
ncbi:hypothetical protein VTN77DRAFT_1769 [Rasamsonia byssochlamydoides]|uniref:uncharacterized protein n=1 Tax=Rasamsonia byssochlamydoides TaxID=89139 RepID=UPI0037441B17